MGWFQRRLESRVAAAARSRYITAIGQTNEQWAAAHTWRKTQLTSASLSTSAIVISTRRGRCVSKKTNEHQLKVSEEGLDIRFSPALELIWLAIVFSWNGSSGRVRLVRADVQRCIPGWLSTRTRSDEIITRTQGLLYSNNTFDVERSLQLFYFPFVFPEFTWLATRVDGPVTHTKIT